MAKEITQDMRDALTAAQEAQSAFWQSMSALEAATGIADITDSQDLEGMTVEDLFNADSDEDEDEDEDECTCADRSWYGPEHDSACPLEGPREVPDGA